MKNVLIVTSEFGKQGGGLSKSCHALALLLCSAGLEVTIVISAPVPESLKLPDKHSEEFRILTNTILVTGGGYRADLSAHLFFRGHVRNVTAHIGNTRPDVIIGFGAGYNGLFAVELNKTIQAKLIIALRGSEVNLAVTDAGLFHFNSVCLQAADAVVGVSHELVQRSKEIYFNPRVIYRVIPNIIRFREVPAPSPRNNGVVFGTGARYLNEKKGIGNLLHVLHHLNRGTGNQFHLRLAGDTEADLLHNYRQLISSLGIEGCVRFLGNLTDEEFSRELETWDFAVQGSFCEGFSNTIGDAISIGKPFMTTDTGFIAEVIREVTPELVFGDLTPQTIADTIRKNCRAIDLTASAAKAAEHLKPLVSEDRVSQLWLQTLATVAGSKPTPAFSVSHILSVLLHDISEACFSGIEMLQAEFERLCGEVHRKGFRFCSARTFFESTRRDGLIVLTFDDAYQGVYDFALPVLQKFSFTATVFVCTDYLGTTNFWNHKDKTARKHLGIEALKELQANGWEIGSHGTNHRSFFRLGTEEMEETLKRSGAILAEHFGSVTSFAYPYGDHNEYMAPLALKYYQNIFAVSKGGTHAEADRHQIRRYTADELLNILKYEGSRHF